MPSGDATRCAESPRTHRANSRSLPIGGRSNTDAPRACRNVRERSTRLERIVPLALWRAGAQSRARRGALGQAVPPRCHSYHDALARPRAHGTAPPPPPSRASVQRRRSGILDAAAAAGAVGKACRRARGRPRPNRVTRFRGHNWGRLLARWLSNSIVRRTFRGRAARRVEHRRRPRRPREHAQFTRRETDTR